MKKNTSVSAMELPYFYVSSAVKYIYEERKKNDDRSSDKVRSNHRKSS